MYVSHCLSQKKAKAGNRKLAFASATRRGEGAVPPLSSTMKETGQGVTHLSKGREKEKKVLGGGVSSIQMLSLVSFSFSFSLQQMEQTGTSRASYKDRDKSKVWEGTTRREEKRREETKLMNHRAGNLVAAVVLLVLLLFLLPTNLPRISPSAIDEVQ